MAELQNTSSMQTDLNTQQKNKEKQNATVKKVQDRMSEIDHHISKLFDIKKRLGKGAYGIVWKAVDKKTKKTIAIKKIFDAFRNQTDAQRTFREIIFLQSFRNHPNIIKLHSIHRASNNVDIYLGFEYMHTDLNNVIKRGNILKDIHKRYIMYQLFKATKYIHSGNVIHRDQKPSNVLIDNACRVKVADFGLARSVSSTSIIGGADPCLTDYVATRWYRAPEILIASKSYTKGIDMWSLGCILGEMILGKPLFPGSSTVNQVERIMSSIPPPTEKDIVAVCTGYGSSLVRTSVTSRTPLQKILQNGPQDAIDLAMSLLVFNPAHRSTATEALTHPYVAMFHQEHNEPELRRDIIPPLSDDLRLSVDEYRNRLYGLMKRESSRNNEIESDSGTYPNDRRSLVPPHQPLKAIRPPNIASQHRLTEVPKNPSVALSGLLTKSTHNSSTDMKMPRSNISNTSKAHKAQLLDPKKTDTEEKLLRDLSRSYKRNPLRRNYSTEEYSTYERRDSSFSSCAKVSCAGQEASRQKSRADLIRSMSDETQYGQNGKQCVYNRNGSYGRISSKSISQIEKTQFNKFNQKFGVITASALKDLQSIIQ